MNKSSLATISGSVFLILIGIVLWNGFVGTDEETSVTTSTSTTAKTSTTTTTSTTIPATATTTIDPNATLIPGSCLVLEEKYCQIITVLTNPNGDKFAAIKLPAGTPIFSPFTGSTGTDPADPTFFVVFEGETGNYLSLTYTGEIDSEFVGKSNIGKGQVLARAGELNFKRQELLAYNLGFAFIRNKVQTIDFELFTNSP